MKKLSFLIVTLLFLSCSDTIDNVETPDSGNNGNNELNVSFNLKNASDPILAVTGLLQASGQDDIAFDFTLLDDVASYNIEHLDAGSWTLSVSAYAATDKNAASLRYTGSTDFQITAGNLTTVNLTLDPTTGELDVSVSWSQTASLAFNIDLAGKLAAITKYDYVLSKTGQTNKTGSFNVLAGAEKITARLDQISQGTWNLTVTGKNASNATVATGTGTVSISPGLVTMVGVANNGATLTLDTSQEIESDGKTYIADEALRKFLVVEKGFMDLREPYIRNEDAESILFLDLDYASNFFPFKQANKGIENYINLDILSAFTNLKELKVTGFTIKAVNTQNHSSLINVEITGSVTEYIDLSGAPNLVALSVGNASVKWIDLSSNLNIQFLQTEAEEGGPKKIISSGLFYEPSFFGVIGSIYIDPSMSEDPVFTETGYYKFVDNSYADSVTVDIPDADASNALHAYNFTMLKDSKVLVSETTQLQEFYYPYEDEEYCKGCECKGKGCNKADKEIFPFVFTYQPLKSVAVLKLFPNLEYLELHNQLMTTIDLSMNPELEDIYISDAIQLTAIDVSNNPRLGINYDKSKSDALSPEQQRDKARSKGGGSYGFDIYYAPALKSVTFGPDNEYLYGINIIETGLETIDLSNLANSLSNAYLYDNQLSSIVFGNVDLSTLDLEHNQLTSLDLTSQRNIWNVYASDNQLTTINLDSLDNLYYLYLDDNQLTSINVSTLSNLYEFHITYNQLNYLDISNLTSLYYLYAYENELDSINLTGATSLSYAFIYSNNLTTLDASNLLQLDNLYAYDNQLTSINLSGSTDLNYVNLSNNLLTTIDLSGLLQLSSLYLQNNNLTGTIDISDITLSPTVNVSNNPLLTAVYFDGNCNGQSGAGITPNGLASQQGCKQ